MASPSATTQDGLGCNTKAFALALDVGWNCFTVSVSRGSKKRDVPTTTAGQPMSINPFDSHPTPRGRPQ
jgi:hypothetical protein